jgi:eukaryotic-like serine/threonine-protein kinase
MKKVLKSFGRYLLLDHLAQGGMAEIFRAWAPSVDGGGRLIVLKCVQPDFGQDVEFLQMFRSEIRVSIGLNHPNIVQLYDFGEVDGRPYIAMELVEGKSLKQLVQQLQQQQTYLPVEFSAYAIEQVAAGLHYAHAYRDRTTGENLNIIHRDISPQNLLIAYTGNVKIIDFGIAKAASNRQNTRAGVIKGKPSYLSPEQISGEVLDGRSDIFCLGTVLWETLTGRKLFAGDSDLAAIRLIDACDKHVKPPSTINPSVSPELDAITLKALSHNRDKRFATAEEMQRALHRAVYAINPSFDPSDFSAYLHNTFKKDMEQEHNELQALNIEARALLLKESLDSIPSMEPSGSSDFLIEPPEVIEDAEDATVKSNKIRRPLAMGPESTGSREIPAPDAQVKSNAIEMQRPSQKAFRSAPLKDTLEKSSSKAPRVLLLGVLAVAAVVYLGPSFGLKIPFAGSHPTAQPPVQTQSQAEPQAPSQPIAPPPAQPAAQPVAHIAMVKLNLSPSGGPVSVSMNGQAVNPAAPIQVPVGLALTVVIQKEGFKPLTKQVTISNEGDFQIDATLEPQQFGFLSLRSTPSAKVQMKMNDLSWTAETPLKEVKFPPGIYQIRLVNDLLGMEKTLSITILRDRIIQRDVDLSVVK